MPTKLNLADLASRGLSIGGTDRDKRNLKFWFDGPDFLWQDYRSWPEQPSDLPEVDDTDVEVKSNKANVGAVIVSENAIPESLSRLIHRPSCWYRLQTSVMAAKIQAVSIVSLWKGCRIGRATRSLKG